MKESREELPILPLELACQHISSDWRQSLSVRRCLWLCLRVSLHGLCAPHKSEHVWMTCLPVYIGTTGGGCLGSKWYKSNYVHLSLSPSLSLQPGLSMPDNLLWQSTSWPACFKLPIGLYMTRQEQTTLPLHICFMVSQCNTSLNE